MMMICSRFDQGQANRLEGGVSQEPVEGDEGNVRPESDQCNPHFIRDDLDYVYLQNYDHDYEVDNTCATCRRRGRRRRHRVFLHGSPPVVVTVVVLVLVLV